MSFMSILHKKRLLKSPVLFFLNFLTKVYVISDFNLDLVISQVLQSTGLWLDTVDLKSSKTSDEILNSCFFVRFYLV